MTFLFNVYFESQCWVWIKCPMRLIWSLLHIFMECEVRSGVSDSCCSEGICYSQMTSEMTSMILERKGTISGMGHLIWRRLFWYSPLTVQASWPVSFWGVLFPPPSSLWVYSEYGCLLAYLALCGRSLGIRIRVTSRSLCPLIQLLSSRKCSYLSSSHYLFDSL